MSNELLLLAFTAASLGFFHTLLGPDHYLPFIVMAKARRWSIVRTLTITFICGAGHLLGSIVLGYLGIIFGISISSIIEIESVRGEVAAWALITFGLLYFAWGLRNVIRNRPHSHWHSHSGGTVHSHDHVHTKEHIHVHSKDTGRLTPWILFVIFILGPCEPLIPLLIYPAAKNSIYDAIFIAGIFSIATIITMLTAVIISFYGIRFIHLKKYEVYSHSMAGATICASGLAIHFLGL